MAEPDFAAYGQCGSIGVITLNDPPANELPRPEFIPMESFRQWTAAHGLKGLIIRGEGRNFSSGGHLATVFNTEPAMLKEMMHAGHALLEAIHRLDIPVIAAINRICFGGGLEIALACHIRVASDNAILAFPEVNQGLMPGMGGTLRLPALTGYSPAAAMILGGDTIHAADALKMGLVDHLAPKDQAFETALALMGKMTNDRPPAVIHSVMRALRNAAELPRNEAMAEEVRMFCSLAAEEARRRKTEEGRP